MAPQMLNVLVTTFPGLGLPRTKSLQVAADSTVGDVERRVLGLLPPGATDISVTTTSNKLLSSRRGEPVQRLLDSELDTFLPLRLYRPICGGKGGFGSQLRAAGGRISSKKKKGEQNGSSRTLDGRRIRTVNEAKALAEYLAIKPEMDKREKNERRQRLEEIVRSTEARKADMLNGGKSRLDGEWVEQKEEQAEKAREAILAALKAGKMKEVFGGQPSDESPSGSESSGDSELDTEELQKSASRQKQSPRKFFGWDEEEDYSSEEGEETHESIETKAKSVDRPET